MRRPVILIVVALMCASPVHAQSLRESVARAAVETAAQPQEKSGNRIPPPYLWTGVGLLGGAALFMVAAAALGGEDCTTSSGPNFTQTVCLQTDTTAGWIVGGALAGAGGVVLALGVKKSRAPSLSVTPRGVTIRQSIPLVRSKRR